MQHFRARKVITRGPTRTVGKFPSTKSKPSLHWKSQLERDRMYALELDPKVTRFREQPMTLNLKVDGRKYRYTPDLLVETANGNWIEEIKPAAKVAEYEALFNAVARECENRGLGFRVVTEVEIQREPFLSNISYLLPFRHRELDEEIEDCIYDAFEASNRIKFGAVKKAFNAAGVPAWGPWALLAHNVTSTDLEQELSDDSDIFLTKGERRCPQWP